MRKRLIGICCLILFQCLLLLSWPATAAAAIDGKRLLAEVWRIVNYAYVDESFNHQNWWLVRRQFLNQPLDTKEATYTAIQQMLATLEDPFTRFLSPEEYRNLRVSTAGELTGVGLQISSDSETGALVVVTPVEGSPAEQAGIQPRDRIVAIDGNPTSELTLDEAATRMRGTIGTHVVLTVEREGHERRDVELVRDRIALNPVRTELHTEPAAVAGDIPLEVGYIRLSQFNGNAAEEVAQAIQRFEAAGVNAYVLDLRNNPGGLLQAGIEIARFWLEDATVVYTVNRQGVFDSYEAGGTVLTEAPLVVLVNQGTASASEILAGALQDNGRAQVIGANTFGKGLIQSLFDLPDGSGLAITVAKYETPNHHDINKVGVQPDRLVPLTEPLRRSQLGTAQDPQYQAAIEILNSHQELARASKF